MKTEQLHLFPELVPRPVERTGMCMKCGRKIRVGRIGAGCLRKIKNELMRCKKELEEALRK